MFDDWELGGEIIKEQFLLTERLKKPISTPDWVQIRFDKRIAEALEAAKWAYQETRLWFFVPSGDNPYTEIKIRRWDECETSSVYGRLLERLSLEELPNYTQENFRNAVAWWQSWQNSRTGRFYNPRYVDPQDPGIRRVDDPIYNEYQSNEKYVPGVLRYLHAEPLYPVQLHGDAEVGEFDYDAMLRFIEVGRIYNSGGKMINDLLRRIDKGNAEGIPSAEYAISYAVEWIDSETGIIAEPGRDWGDYGALEPTLKTYGRMIGQQGIENLPPEKMQAFADFVVEHQSEFVSRRSPGNIRNTAELMLLAIAVSDYRRDEIIEALIKHSESVVDSELWKTGYPAYACRLIGGMIWWKDFPPERAAGPHLGGWFGHRILMCPYNRWANLILKRAEERGEEPTYDFKKFGLKYRNREHWGRKVYEIVPNFKVSGGSWRFFSGAVPENWAEREFDDTGWDTGLPPYGADDALYLRRNFKLDHKPMEFPWLRADWNGRFRVFLNGIPVKSTIRKWKRAGWYLPEAARASLRQGKNTVGVECLQTGSTSSIDVGLIDWKL
jgi:hypothetical protein